MHSHSWKRLPALLLAGALALAGCSGDDGSAGPQGPIGPTGPAGQDGQNGQNGQDGQNGQNGQNAYFTDLESCSGCHGGVASGHALSDQLGVQVTLPATAVAIDDVTQTVTVTFNVKVNGVPRFDFNQKASVARSHNEDAFWVYDADGAPYPAGVTPQAAPNDNGPAGVRTKIPAANWTFATFQNGNVVATITGLTALSPALPWPPPAGTRFMLSVMNARGETATAVATYGAPARNLVSNQACVNCHGRLVWRDAAHDVTYPQGVEACVVCHNRVGSADPRLAGAGSGLTGIVHGIHNSHNMPDGQYTFTWTNGNQFNFSIGFPGYMTNCSTCHDTAEGIAAATAMTVTYSNCISCHDSMLGFPRIAAATSGSLNTHKSYTMATDCGGCHTGAFGLVTAFHNGLKTERNGLIWDGVDQSVVLGEAVEMAITGVSLVAGPPAQLQITWTATQGGAAVNPCNQDLAAGPIFFGVAAPTGTPPTQPAGTIPPDTATGLVASNLSILRAYMQGDDWVNAGVGSSPGQPSSAVNVTPANTACSGNVATTTVDAETTTAARASVAIQGKPQVRFAAAAGTANEVIQVRAKSPVREFVVATGAAPAASRRQIVDIDKCNACHLGSMYQHGGNRVDSIELCVMCHNPAANEANNRVGFGIDASEAYDQQPGETYDLRYMVHAIHSAAETDAALVFYRSIGVYLFGSKAARDAAPNWPGEGCNMMYGSSTTAVGRDCTGQPGGTNNHVFVEVHYPRPLNDCAACHVDGWVPGTPDPTKAVAVTIDAGAAPWSGQLDDVLLGASAASCMSCHRSGDPAVEFGLKVHAYGNGWIPATFENGRQTILDAAARPLP